MNKRGIFFTVIAILLVSFAVLTYVSFTVREPNTQAIQTRIFTLDNFLIDTQRDMDRAWFISGTRAMLALQQSVIESGVYIDDVYSAFSGAAVNGSYSNLSLGLVENSSLQTWRNKVEQKANQVGVTISIQLADATITHIDPWTLQATVDTTIGVSDVSNLASFTTNYTTVTNISIIGLEDPIHVVNTLARVPRQINQTPYSQFVTTNDTNNLMDHVTKGYYIAHSDAPSYLDRMEGKLNTSSVFGIESLVNTSALVANGLSGENNTAVDYLYWQDNPPSAWCIQNTPAWFMLDNDHLATYDVDGLTC
jgi:hypothetical protein